MRLKNKVAIVTGSGSGFGAGIAECFAAAGAAVVVNDINAAAAQAVADKITAAGHTAIAVAGDVSRADDMAQLISGAVGRFNSLDIMVNNAGITHKNQPMLETSEADYERVFAVNVKACFLAAHEVVPLFRKQGGGGVILNIASVAGLRPRPGLTWYCASKGAVITMTKSMAIELAGESIRVNALCPVAGDTPLLSKFLTEDTQQGRDAMISSIPMGRLASAGDVADAALFLVSDDARFVTGSVLEVDGGRSI